LEVQGVGDLITALYAIPTFQPDLILSQMRLHIYSGFDLIRCIKDDHSASLIPVILYSEASPTEQRVQAFDQGAADFLCKPFASAELIARVRAALKIRHTLSLLEQRACIDGLTGLANRSMFEDQYVREWDKCQRRNLPLSVIIADLDHFKRINDLYGHAVGDEVLRRSAQVLARTVRRSDLVARYGGEEFVVVAPCCSAAAAVAVATRFRDELTVPTCLNQSTISITASVGIAMANWTHDTPQDLLQRADHALYEAKNTGRDAIWIHDSLQNGPRAANAFGIPVANAEQQ
jgi:diguanylate cyclase (GGDEF)-like protein